MNTSLKTLVSVAGAALFMAACTISVAQETTKSEQKTASVPRYQLQVGQELIYEASLEFKHARGSHGSSDAWNIWVVRENPDGSWRVIIRYSSRFYQVMEGGQRLDQPARSNLAYADLFPDGRVTSNPTLRYWVNPYDLFLPLPADAEAAKAGWKHYDPEGDVHYNFQMSKEKPPKPNQWVFEVVQESLMNQIYLMTSKATVYFDTQRGLPERIENEHTQGYGFEGKGTGTITLKDIKTHDVEWMQKLAQEADIFFEHNAKFEELMQEARKDPAKTEAVLAQAGDVLKVARAKITLPLLQEQLDKQLEEQQGMKEYLVTSAQEFSQVFGHPAPEWEATDLEGTTHSLTQYQGKVVILDFWYRGCGWCIRAMPQLKEIVEHFKDKPVVVLGMNTDRKEEDARFVVEKLKLNYPTLKATGIPEKYKVAGYPTLIIIDQQGVVRDVHIGYSSTLRDEVIKTVESLF